MPNAEKRQGESMAEADLTNLKVLIVEDNPHFRTLVRTILGALGVEQVEEARDGGEAIEALKTFSADLAILDWKMEKVDGLECVRRLRHESQGPNRFLPIIMVTGFADPHLARQARDAGVNDFLSKPISAKSLLSRIVSVVENPRSFVETDGYFGPDRRYRSVPHDGPDRRQDQASLIEPRRAKA